MKITQVQTAALTTDLLREQLEDQKRRFEDTYRHDLAKQKRGYEEALEDYAQRTERMGEDVRSTCEVMKKDLEAACRERDELKREVEELRERDGLIRKDEEEGRKKVNNP